MRSHAVPAILLALFLATISQGSVSAHSLGENYVFVNFREASIDGRFEIHFGDLKDKLGLDFDDAGTDTSARIRATASQIHDYIRRNFSIGPEGGVPYTLEFTLQEVLPVSAGTFAQYHFRADTGPLPDRLAIRHEMLYENDRFHRGLLLVEHNIKTGTNYGTEYVAMVFSPTNGVQSLDLTSIPSLLGGRAMIWQGILHIWIGIDHILFLLALILPTVLMPQGGSWAPVPGFPGALWNVLKIITVFTVAHSLTLLLAALGLLDVPSRLVESVIALSIVLVAWNNITGRIREGSSLIILGLGLFHGLGFASVMGHLPFRMEALLKSVVGFNIGVELGQAAIVAVLFPLLFLLRKPPFYVPVVLKGGSAVLILIAGVWFVQRAFGLA